MSLNDQLSLPLNMSVPLNHFSLQKSVLVFLAAIQITICFSGCSAPENTISPSSTSVDFTLDNDALKAGFVVMYVPVTLEGIPTPFRMQFDLGLDVNVIYGNALEALAKEFPSIVPIERADYSILLHKLRLGDVRSNVDSLFVYSHFGDADVSENQIIGSIGLNELQGKVTIIDFQKRTLSIQDSLPVADTSNYNFSKLELRGSKLFVSLSVDGQQHEFLFDTGNGKPFVTIDRDFFDAVTAAQREPVDTVSASSWGETIELYGAKTQSVLKLGGTIVNMSADPIYYTESRRIRGLYEGMGVSHSMGVDMFLDSKIVLDLVDNRFGVLANLTEK